MKKQLTIIFVLLAFIVFGQNDSIKNANLEKRISRLEKNMDTVKQDENSLYQLKRDIIQTKNDSYKLRKHYENEHDSMFAKFLTHYISWLTAIFLALISILGYKKFISEYRKRIENEVKEKVKIEVDKKVPIEVEKYLKPKINIISNEFKNIEKHNSYKTNSKILIINKKGTKFPKYLETILKLFSTDITNKSNLIELESLKDITESQYKSMKEADIVIIENKVPEKVWSTTDHKDEYIALANKICNTTALLYFGDGHFPIKDVDEEKQHLISYTNAPSQLYGNLLNLLKYVNELRNEK